MIDHKSNESENWIRPQARNDSNIYLQFEKEISNIYFI